MEAVKTGLKIKDLPEEVGLTARVVVKAPSFDEVRTAYRWGRTVTVGYVMVTVGSGQIMAGTYYEMSLCNIKGLEYSAARRAYWFEASSFSSYERSSYNQSSTVTERIDWRIQVMEDGGNVTASIWPI